MHDNSYKIRVKPSLSDGSKKDGIAFLNREFIINRGDFNA